MATEIHRDRGHKPRRSYRRLYMWLYNILSRQHLLNPGIEYDQKPLT